MNRRTFLSALPSLATGTSLIAGSHILFQDAADEDTIICKKKFEFAAAASLKTKPIGEVIAEIGKTFLGTEYVGHVLEAQGEEQLVINLRALDCVSFCENCIVLARCIKKSKTTFDDYKKELQFIRYRGGVIDRYPSRLHYFSDYIFDNEKKKVFKNITEELGGVPYKKKVTFMSTHPESYRQLMEHPDFVKIIQKQETEISRRKMVHIPKEAVARVASKIPSGSVIGITTTIEGMDIAHTGIAIRHEGELRFMHAPMAGKQVQITPTSLADYLQGHPKHIGIMVARVLEPLIR
ncbi:MAG: N-acetylmuramoyl-L-alanine amidase-like domain-containing protein [bacterium]